LNQRRRDRAAKDIGLHSVRQLPGESVNAFCLRPASGKPSARQAVFDLVGGNTSLEVKRNARDFVQSELSHHKETVGLIGGSEG
jgi:hypothetical protein